VEAFREIGEGSCPARPGEVCTHSLPAILIITKIQTQAASRGQIRQPPVAELVAEALRNQILAGVLKNGDLLPRQEDLLREFGVSKPSIREALRILETEGLITVQRGNVGGARVHAPQERDAAYMLGLVLQARGVALDDVAVALRLTEPVCASLCAQREDREEQVLPRLREVHAQAVEQVDDHLAFTNLTQSFHQELVAACGNETLIVMTGALEALWTARQAAWAAHAAETVSFPDLDVRRGGLKAHARIIELIERGDAEGVARALRKHLETIDSYTAPNAETISITALRGWQLQLAAISRGRGR
jgi:GntR family transcriptional regulator, transcriptional repressor for pyruvate dehydrogenase complex